MAGLLTLTIVTPAGAGTAVTCDSIRLLTPDGIRKQAAGGSIGIRYGHADAMIALAEGPIKALLEGKTVLEGTLSGGFATVSGGHMVSVLTDRFELQML